MAWVKVPPEHRPLFFAALPAHPLIDITPLFGGIAAKVRGNFFAGLFGASVIVDGPEALRAEALALPGASRFDPMGDGRMTSRKVMLPPSMMRDAAALERWLARAFQAATALPPKAAARAGSAKRRPAATASTGNTPAKKAPAKKAPAKKAPAKKAPAKKAPAKKAGGKTTARRPPARAVSRARARRPPPARPARSSRRNPRRG